MRIALIAIVVFLTGCIATLNERIESPLNGSVYNSLASKYYERQTSIEYEEAAGQTRLYVSVKGYGSDKERIWFGKEYVEQYLVMIDKYMSWNKTALKSGDVINKEIGIAESAGGVNIKFIFYSGNSKNHYLIMQSGLFGSYSGGIMVDSENAEYLRKLLVDFGKGALKFTDESKYK